MSLESPATAEPRGISPTIDANFPDQISGYFGKQAQAENPMEAIQAEMKVAANIEIMGNSPYVQQAGAWVKNTAGHGGANSIGIGDGTDFRGQPIMPSLGR